MHWCECCGQPVDGDFSYPVSIAGVTLEDNVLYHGKSNKRLLGGAAVMFRLLATRGRLSHEAFAAVKQSEALCDQASVYAWHLRKALKRLHAPLQIATVYGWGYRLLDLEGKAVAQMDRVSEQSQSAGIDYKQVDTLNNFMHHLMHG